MSEPSYGLDEAPPPGDPAELATTAEAGRRTYLTGQQLLRASHEAEDLIHRRGGTAPELAEGRDRIESQLDAIADHVRQADAVVAARATADGGSPLTTAQAAHFLAAISASHGALALYREEPDEMTAMLNRLLTTLEGPFETRLGLIATHLRQV